MRSLVTSLAQSVVSSVDFTDECVQMILLYCIKSFMLYLRLTFPSFVLFRDVHYHVRHSAEVLRGLCQTRPRAGSQGQGLRVPSLLERLVECEKEDQGDYLID